MSGESRMHRELKRAALLWAQARGYRIAAWEVRVPRSSYRADVAAYNPAWRSEHVDRAGTAIFECKQSRPDFLNDSRPIRETLERLEKLHSRRKKLERQLGVHYPGLRSGDSLFPEFLAYAFEELEHRGYRSLMREIRRLENRIYGKTKFERMIRYGCAHLFYVVTPPGILEEHEVPVNWGWLEMAPVPAPAGQDPDNDPSGPSAEGGVPAVARLTLRRRPVFQEIPPEHARELLHCLALRGTSQINRQAGISYDQIREVRGRVAD